MDGVYKTHQDVPYGYWVFGVEPALKAISAKWRAHRAKAAERAARELATPPWRFLRLG